MDEKSFRDMMDRASDRRQRDLDLAFERARRRETLLERAISTNRVRVDYQALDAEDTAVKNPRRHFEQDLARLLRQQREPTEDDLDRLLDT